NLTHGALADIEEHPIIFVLHQMGRISRAERALDQGVTCGGRDDGIVDLAFELRAIARAAEEWDRLLDGPVLAGGVIPREIVDIPVPEPTLMDGELIEEGLLL